MRAGRVKLLSAGLHQEKAVIGQVRVPDDTTEVTQVKELLRDVDLDGAVVTADAVHSCRETAQYIAGKEDDGGRESDYFLFVKGNTPSLQRAAFDAIQASGPGRDPDYTELDRSHGRVIRRSLWVADVGDAGFPHATHVARIRRDRYDADGCLVSKEIVHAVTSLGADRADAVSLAGIARGQWGIESVHWVATPFTPRTPAPGTRDTGRRSWPRCGTWPSACSTSTACRRLLAPSRPFHATETGCSTTCRYETQVSNDFGDPVRYT